MSTTETTRATAQSVRVHTPYRRGLPDLALYFRDLWGRRQFAVELARTQIRAQHLNTALGQLWLLLNPLLFAGVYYLLITIVRHGARNNPDYLPHIMAGLFIFYFIQSCMNSGAGSIVSGGRLILNTAFPKVLLPLSAVLVAIYRFIPTMLVFVIVRLASGAGLSLTMLWGLPIFVIFAIFGAGAAMLVATLNLYFRDVGSFLPYITRVWLYVSPVLWFASDIAAQHRDLMAIVNPLFGPLAVWSRVMVQDHQPRLAYLLIGGGWAVVVLLLGAYVFLSREREFAVRL
jgi:teichoic acid transport system permease protein